MLPVLNPFKPARRHATGVGEDVGENDDATGIEDGVGLGRDRGVGRLDDDRGLDRGGVGGGEDAPERCRNENVAVGGEELLAADPVSLGVAVEPAAVGQGVLEHAGDVEAVGPVVGTAGITDGDEAAFGVVEEAGGEGADVPEALQRDPRSGELPAGP